MAGHIGLGLAGWLRGCAGAKWKQGKDCVAPLLRAIPGDPISRLRRTFVGSNARQIRPSPGPLGRYSRGGGLRLRRSALPGEPGRKHG